jgi:hypothetical protein
MAGMAKDGATTFGIKTLRIMTFSIEAFHNDNQYMEILQNDIRHNDT